MFRIAEFAPQAKKIHRETQYQSQRFVPRIAADLSRKLFDRLGRKLLGVYLLQDLLDPFQFVLGNQSFAQLLQVQWRMKLRGNRPNFVTREDVVKDFVLFQPLQQARKQIAAQRTQRFRLRGGIEKAPGVLRIVQIVAQPRVLIF